MNEIYAPQLQQKYDFNDEFKQLCRTLNKRVREDWDAVFAVTGEEGSGKSTCINQIGFMTDDKYTLKKNVLFSPSKEELKDKMINLPRFSFINADEAIRILYKLQFHQPMQIYINKLYRLCRQENKITALAMPRFSEFTEGFRNHRIIIWVHLIERGCGVVFMKDWSPFAKDPWWFDENQRKLDNYMHGRKIFDMTVKDKIKVLSKARTFWGVITFPDLQEEVRIEYKQLASETKYEGLDGEYEQQMKVSRITEFYHKTLKNAILYMRKKDPNMSERDISSHLHVSQPFVNKVLKGDSDSDNEI